MAQTSDRDHTTHDLFETLSKMHDGQIFEYVLKEKEPEDVDRELVESIKSE